MLSLEDLVKQVLTASIEATETVLQENQNRTSLIEVMKELAVEINTVASENFLALVILMENALTEHTPVKNCQLIKLTKGFATFINQNIAEWEDLAIQNYDETASATEVLNTRWMPNTVLFKVGNIQSYYVNINDDIFTEVFADIGELSQLDLASCLWLAYELFKQLTSTTGCSLLIAPEHPEGQEKYRELVCLKAASAGIQSHTSHNSNYQIAVPLIDSWIDYTKDYSQFSGLVNLLSESNSYEFSLDKFLRKYQVLEEVMFRQGLIKVMRRVRSPTISLRQWKSVSENMGDNERITFSKLIEGISITSASLAIPLFSETKTKWASLLTLISAKPNANALNQQINELLHSVWDERYSFSAGLFDNDANGKLLGFMIYAFRCSIVHNKATEFFLSSQSYDEGTGIFFDEFLLPIVDYMVLFSISHPGSGSRYPQQSLNLW